MVDGAEVVGIKVLLGFLLFIIVVIISFIVALKNRGKKGRN